MFMFVDFNSFVKKRPTKTEHKTTNVALNTVQSNSTTVLSKDENPLRYDLF